MLATTVAGLSRLGERLSPPLLDALLPRSGLLTKLVAVVVGVAAMALISQARIPLPFTPVPLTLQTFGVLMIGGVLGWRWGVITLSAYYLVGVAGLPVFAQGNGGWEYASAATGGYLLGFILAAGAMGLVSQMGAKRWTAIWAGLAAGVAVYIPGLIWLSTQLPANIEATVLEAGLYPFIPGDLIKLVAASLALGGLWRWAERRGHNPPEARDDS